MSNQLCLEDIKIGMNLPILKKKATSQQLVMYAGASGDYYQIHYDQDYAKSNDLPGIIIHGALKNAFLGQLITDWIGEYGNLLELSVQYRGMDVPEDELTITGIVSDIKVNSNKSNTVYCDIWIENSSGKKSTIGKAIVNLPYQKRSK